MKQGRATQRSWWRTIQWFFFTLGSIGFVATVLAGFLLYREITASLPPMDSLLEYRAPMSTQIFAADGTLVGEFYYEKRQLVPLDEIPAVVRNAFIAAEDDQFYQHPGVDLFGIARALWNNLSGKGRLQGGSTITQQVVKQILLTPQKSYERKIKEILLAVRLERQLSKDQILYLYLNHIYLGSGAYGVAAAAEEYFGKSVSELSLAEAALLAGLPQAPSRYSPFRHWQRAKARQQYVLERMVRVGMVSPAEAILAAREPLALVPKRGNYRHAPYYVEHVRRLLQRRYGEQGLYQLGLRVYTALDLRLQTLAEEALQKGLRDLQARQKYSPALRQLDREEQQRFLAQQREQLAKTPLQPGRSYEALVTAHRPHTEVRIGDLRGKVIEPSQLPVRAGDVIRVRLHSLPGQGEEESGLRFVLDTDSLLQGAAVVMDPTSGDVHALVGGTNFFDSQFNRATQARRQPGSAFKPFVYAAAFDDRFTPASVVLDTPIALPSGNGVWAPQNYDHQFFGPTTLRDALAFSRNVPTVRLAQAIGIQRLVTFARSLGISSPLVPNLSLALGAAEVTPLELVSAYSAFANQGIRAEPRFITQITAADGSVLESVEPRTSAVLAAETAYLVTNVLQDVITRGTGRRAAAIGRPAAGKTGTTNDMNDAWFIGYVPQLLAGFWVGFDSKRSLGPGETGGRVAAPIWLDFMQAALAGEPVLDFPVPKGVRFVPIDRRSGRRTAATSPGAFIECFRAGTEPSFAEGTDATAQPAAAIVSDGAGY